MSRQVTPLMMVCAILVGGVISASDVDPIEKKLQVAREKFDNVAEKARHRLLDDLVKKEEAARKAGDLKMLETIQAEARKFADSGKLPSVVLVKNYENQMRRARASLEETYMAAVKQYTKDGKIGLAKAVQQELDEFKKSGTAAVSTAGDPLKVKSVWVGQNPLRVFTITERNGEKFTAKFEIGERGEREVKGTIKDGKLSWLAKDDRAVRGVAKGRDTRGTLGSDEAGDKIDFAWSNDEGASGTFTLRVSKGK